MKKMTCCEFSTRGGIVKTYDVNLMIILKIRVSYLPKANLKKLLIFIARCHPYTNSDRKMFVIRFLNTKMGLIS
jgi:hypothetical protein